MLNNINNNLYSKDFQISTFQHSNNISLEKISSNEKLEPTLLAQFRTFFNSTQTKELLGKIKIQRHRIRTLENKVIPKLQTFYEPHPELLFEDLIKTKQLKNIIEKIIIEEVSKVTEQFQKQQYKINLDFTNPLLLLQNQNKVEMQENLKNTNTTEEFINFDQVLTTNTSENSFIEKEKNQKEKNFLEKSNSLEQNNLDSLELHKSQNLEPQNQNYHLNNETNTNSMKKNVSKFNKIFTLTKKPKKTKSSLSFNYNRPIPRVLLTDEQITGLVINEVNKVGGGAAVSSKRKWSRIARNVADQLSGDAENFLKKKLRQTDAGYYVKQLYFTSEHLKQTNNSINIEYQQNQHQPDSIQLNHQDHHFNVNNLERNDSNLNSLTNQNLTNHIHTENFNNTHFNLHINNLQNNSVEFYQNHQTDSHHLQSDNIEVLVRECEEDDMEENFMTSENHHSIEISIDTPDISFTTNK